MPKRRLRNLPAGRQANLPLGTKKYMKTVGIIGGFGPAATAQFYLKLTAKTRAHIIVRHVLVPQKLEHDALVHGKNLDAFIPLLTSAAADLEHHGADLIVLPCNTLHVHEDVIRRSASVPFISIIDATAQFLLNHHISRVGFLGSRVTIQENLFKKHVNNINFVTVPADVQKEIDTGLDQFVRNQNPTKLQKALTNAFIVLTTEYVTDVLLACTDFGGFCPKIPGMRIHDTVDILVSATVNML